MKSAEEDQNIFRIYGPPHGVIDIMITALRIAINLQDKKKTALWRVDWRFGSENCQSVETVHQYRQRQDDHVCEGLRRQKSRDCYTTRRMESEKRDLKSQHIFFQVNESTEDQQRRSLIDADRRALEQLIIDELKTEELTKMTGIVCDTDSRRTKVGARAKILNVLMLRGNRPMKKRQKSGKEDDVEDQIISSMTE